MLCFAEFPQNQLSGQCRQTINTVFKKCSKQSLDHLFYHCTQTMLAESIKGISFWFMKHLHFFVRFTLPSGWDASIEVKGPRFDCWQQPYYIYKEDFCNNVITDFVVPCHSFVGFKVSFSPLLGNHNGLLLVEKFIWDFQQCNVCTGLLNHIFERLNVVQLIL